MDLTRVLGALLGGAAAPPRRRRRTPGILGSRGGSQLGRVIGTAAAVAIEAMIRNSRQPAEPPQRDAAREPPPPRARTTDIRAEAPRMPQTGASPWNRPAPPPAPPPRDDMPDAEDAESLLLVRAMIAAAKADGAVDAAERRAIGDQLDAAGLDAAERDFVLADFDRPLTPEALAREATDPMLRARLYAAAVAAMGVISAPERDWLDRLAKAMKLDRAAAAAIEERLQE